MDKKEQIKLILYRAADELAELFAESDEQDNGPPVMMNVSELARFTGLSRPYVSQLVKRMEQEEASGVFRGPNSTRVNYQIFQKWIRRTKKNELFIAQ